MCLNIRSNSKRLVAKKDITVYKVLTLREMSAPSAKKLVVGAYVYSVTNKFYLRSVAKGFRYTIGKSYTAKLGTPNYANEIESGFHSFSDSANVVRRRELYSNRTEALVECIIPKGATYYNGTNNGTSKGRVSDQIKIVKIL